MATATAMYHSGKNPLRKVTYKSDAVTIVKSEEQRRLHKAFLRYHDPKGWPMLREALTRMGRADLIGSGKDQLIPLHQPSTDSYQSARRKNSTPAGSHKVAKAKPPPRSSPSTPACHPVAATAATRGTSANKPRLRPRRATSRRPKSAVMRPRARAASLRASR